MITSGDDAGASKIFISYSRSDLEIVLRLQAALTARGVEVGIDREGVEKSEEWWPRIKQLIAESNAFVFALSVSSMESPICLDELAFAVSLHKRIIPVVVSDLVGARAPEVLARLNYIFFAGRPDGVVAAFDDSVEQLIHTLRTNIAWIREHTRLGLLASRWVERGRPSVLLLRGAELEAAETWIAEQPRNSPSATDLHRRFISESRRGSTRRRRIALATATLIAVVLAVLSTLAYRQKRNVVRTLSAGLLAKANEDLQNGRVPDAAVLAADALQKDPENWQAYATVFAGMARLQYRLRYTKEWCDEKQCLAVSRDGDYVATLDERGNNDSFIVNVEQAPNGRQAARLELHGYPDAGVFSRDGRYLFLVGTKIVALDLARGAIRATLPAKTREEFLHRYLRDPDPNNFWTVDFRAMYRFDMKALAYDNTVIAYQKLHAPGFIVSRPTQIARRTSDGVFALAVAGQSEGYTGEADNTGRIFLFELTMTRCIGMINSGLVSDMAFGGAGSHAGDVADALYVAKPGGTIERWEVPAGGRAMRQSDEVPALERKEVIVSRPPINFYTSNPDPALSAKTQILFLGDRLAVFTAGRMDLIDVKSGRRIDSGLFDSREIDYFSDGFRIVNLTAGFATVSRNEIAQPKTQCGRLRVWDVTPGEVEAIDLRDIFKRTFEERRSAEWIFEDLGFTGDWKIKSMGHARSRIAYLSQEADTRYSTRVVLNMVDVDESGSRLIGSQNVADEVHCDHSQALFATDAEVCAVCRSEAKPVAACMQWTGVPGTTPSSVTAINSIVNRPPRRPSSTELLMSRIVASIGGEGLESAADGSAVLFRKGHTPFLWRGTDVLSRPVNEIRARILALTGLRAADGLGVEVNATRYVTKASDE